MRRQDRELLADLAGVNTALPAFAQRVLGDYATPAEHDAVADRLIWLGQAIRRRAAGLSVINPEPDDDGTINKNTAAHRALSALVDMADALRGSRRDPVRPTSGTHAVNPGDVDVAD